MQLYYGFNTDYIIEIGYPENMTVGEMKKVNFLEKCSKKSKGSKGVPFPPGISRRFHSSLNCFSRIIKGTLNILYMSCEAKVVLSTGPMISFRSAHRISCSLVKAELYLLERF